MSTFEEQLEAYTREQSQDPEARRADCLAMIVHARNSMSGDERARVDVIKLALDRIRTTGQALSFMEGQELIRFQESVEEAGFLPHVMGFRREGGDLERDYLAVQLAAAPGMAKSAMELIASGQMYPSGDLNDPWYQRVDQAMNQFKRYPLGRGQKDMAKLRDSAYLEIQDALLQWFMIRLGLNTGNLQAEADKVSDLVARATYCRDSWFNGDMVRPFPLKSVNIPEKWKTLYDYKQAGGVIPRALE